MARLGVRGSYVCVPWLINSLCTPPFSFAKSSEITGQDIGVRRRKFLCSSSPSPASCVCECERVPGRSQQNAWGRRIRLGTESAVWGKRWWEDDGELHPSSIYLKVTHPLGALEGINSSNTVANWMFWIRCCSMKKVQTWSLCFSKFYYQTLKLYKIKVVALTFLYTSYFRHLLKFCL